MLCESCRANGFDVTDCTMHGPTRDAKLEGLLIRASVGIATMRPMMDGIDKAYVVAKLAECSCRGDACNLDCPTCRAVLPDLVSTVHWLRPWTENTQVSKPE